MRIPSWLVRRHFDLVISFDLDDHVLLSSVRPFPQEDEVRIVASDSTGVRVDVLGEEVRLAVGQHSGEVELLDLLLA